MVKPSPQVKRLSKLARRAIFLVTMGMWALYGWILGYTMKHPSPLRIFVVVVLGVAVAGGFMVWRLARRTYKMIEEEE